MRDIKFRAWHEGYPVGVDPQMIYDAQPGDCLRWKNEGQSIKEIMQYTGLKDEAGIEIYEGDHLFAPGNLSDELEYVGDVVWDEVDARFEVVNIHGRFEYIPNGCYVKGHIYLLEANHE